MTQATEVARAVEGVARALAVLEAAGRGVPAVEKNGARMKGTLRALQDQFAELAALGEGR